MADEQERRFNDREFALILNRAAELGASRESSIRQHTGLSLEEIRAIAVEAGFEPGLIDRAVRELPSHTGTSALERAIGGPLKHERTARFDRRLTEEQSAHLLAMVRAAAEQQGEGTATASGMSWNSVGEGSQLFVTAHREEEGTRVRVVVNRHDVLAVTGVISVMAGGIIPLMIASVLDSNSVAINAAIFAGGFGGSLATARALWSATTTRWGQRAGALMDLMARTLDQDTESGAPAPDQGAERSRLPDQSNRQGMTAGPQGP